jgi:hypothetical protein
MVQIPAQWVSAGHGVPDLCVKHGLPPTQRRKLRLISKPPGWALPLVVFGAIIYLIVVMAVRKTVVAPAWPFCDECKQQRSRSLLIGGGLLVLSVVVFIGSAGVIDSNSGVGGLGMMLSFVLFLVAVILMARANWVNTSRAIVSRDGQWVEVNAGEPFTRAALALQAQAGAPPPGYGQSQYQQQYQQR